MTYQEWCIANNCSHAHCPNGCEHPQPIVGANAKCYCGRCYFKDNKLVEVIPCNKGNENVAQNCF